MTPKQQFICKLVGIILGALTPIVLALLTFLQAQGNKATALRDHEEVRRRHRFSTRTPAPAPVPEPEPSMTTPVARPRSSVLAGGRKTNLEAVAESARVAAEVAADDTTRVLVQPTTIGKLLGQKARSMTVRALRKQ